MKIEKVSDSDKQCIEELSRTFHFEEDRNWDEVFASGNQEMFVVKEDENVLGFTGFTYWDWNNTIQIIDIFVHPDSRCKGIGNTLIQYLIEKAKMTKYRCILAEVPSLNPVLKLYLKNGFRLCGYNDRYYSNSGKEVALWMSYDLK